MVEGARHLLCDNRAASELAADHLAGLGLRHFAFAGFDRALWSSERSQHFCRRLAELGHAAQTYLVPLITPELEKPRQEAMLVRWLKNLPKPVGIMACNDDFGRSLAEMCRLHGLRVPDDVALIGVDNDELICELSSPPLSSISFAVERAGYEAAELLDQLMAGKKPAIQSIAVPVGNVVARQSTNVLAIHDDEVIKALRFIRDNADRIIEVSDVVDATLLSHRTLHNRFRRALGHSLVAEMNQQRAAHIAQLLLGTNDSVGRIARAMGYYNAAHLSRFFRREMGITPRAYRLMRQGRQEFATGDRSARELAGRPARRGAGRGGRGRSQKSV